MTVRLPDDLRQRIAALADVTRRSQGDIVREALERDLPNLEWELGIARKARAHRAGDVVAIPAADVDRLLGLDGVEPAPDALTSIS